MNIKLNCDMGESYGIYNLGLDKQIIPHIDMANLACGFHASDPVTMHQSVKLAKRYQVTIGCHPSYPDLVGFGRREMSCSTEEIIAFILYQLGALDAICKSYDTKVSYLKPHGALYNKMMQDEPTFKAIAKAIAKYDPRIKLMILSTPNNAHYESLAKKYGITLLYELFADRGYTDEALLVPRTQKGAMLTATQTLERAKLLFEKGTVLSVSGKVLNLPADTLCLHGDNPEAVTLIKTIRSLRDDH